MIKRYLEPAREIDVFDEGDIIVVGAGPAGHSAAIAASRAGAKKVILVERYNHLGGMPTGGFVLYVPSIGDPRSRDYRIYGLQKEWKERLSKYEFGILTATDEEIGSKDPAKQEKWKGYTGFLADGDIDNCFYVDPDTMKIVLDQMIEDEKGKIVTYSECWAVDAIVEDGTIKGVVIESKEGRKALMGKVVIDATGDGDIAYFAGCGYDDTWKTGNRSSNIAVCCRLGGVDYAKFMRYKASLDANGLAELTRKCREFTGMLKPLPTNRNDYTWINTLFPGSCLKIRDLNKATRTTRLGLHAYIEFLHQFPGLEKAYLVDLAPQTGTRGGRRIFCEHTLTDREWASPIHHKDVILITGAYTRKTDDPVWIPYRCMVPLQCDNLIVTGRAFSSTAQPNDDSNTIPHCIVFGQAAGIAAQIALEDGVLPRKIDIKRLHDEMRRQDMFVPEGVE